MTFSPLIILSSVCAGFSVWAFTQWGAAAWDSYSRNHVAELIPQLRALDMDDAMVDRYLRLWGVLMVVVFTGFAVLMAMPVVAVAATYLVFVAPKILIIQQIERRKIIIRDQLVRAVVGIANAARANLTLFQGLELVAKESPKPLSKPLGQIVFNIHSGQTFDEAIRDVQNRMQLESFSVFAATMLVARKHGGDVTVALDKISLQLQEMQRLERKLESDTAAGRRMSMILSMFPIVFLIGFTMLDPVSTGYLYNTIIGQAVLVVVMAVVYISWRWCNSILALEY